MDQTERIQRFTRGEVPPPVRLRLRFSSTTSAGPVLEKARHVMRLVASAQRNEWFSDENWKNLLPDWFVRSFEGHSTEQLLHDSTLWDFGSWLDAMKNPGWEWWSCEERGQEGTVWCTAHSNPYSIEPLMYVLRTAGASDVDFHQE